MIIYRCDRCRAEVMPDHLYDVEVVMRPRDIDGGEDCDKETRTWLGQVCEACSGAVDDGAALLIVPAQADRQPASAGAVDPADGTTTN